MTVMETKTYWWCRECGEEGGVLIPAHLDFLSGLKAVYVSHSFTSPDCEEVYYIRVGLEPIPAEMKVRA